MPKPTILLADNDADFLTIAQEFLETRGYEVITVSSPAEVRCILKKEPVALAVVDFRLVDDQDASDRSGLNLARDPALAGGVPRIILTKFPGHESATESLRPRRGEVTTVVDYVAKQQGLDALLASIQRTLVQAQVFLCYARPDEKQVNLLYDQLRSAGFVPWMDRRRIVGGEKWRRAIGSALRKSHFCVVCLSSKSVDRRGYMQKEIRIALDIWEEMLDKDIYLIPVRLEECNVAHEELQKLQWVDLFHEDGFQKLAYAIRTGMRRRGLSSYFNGGNS